MLPDKSDSGPTPVPEPGPDELVQLVIPQRLVRVFERRVLFAAGTLVGPLVFEPDDLPTYFIQVPE